MRRKSPNSVQMQENTGQKKLRIWMFARILAMSLCSQLLIFDTAVFDTAILVPVFAAVASLAVQRLSQI